MTILHIRGGLLLTFEGADAPREGDLWIRDGEIIAVGSSPPDLRADASVDAGGCFVLPGFIQGHLHLIQTLHRGLAEGMSLLEWLTKIVWPLEAAHDEFTIRAAARTGIVECIESGVTTIFDMGTTRGHQYIFEELHYSGIRAFSGKAMMDLSFVNLNYTTPPELRETTNASLDESELLANKYDGANGGRLRYCYAPRFALSATPELHREVARRAAANGRAIHTHAGEQRAEAEAVRLQFGDTCFRYLQKVGLSEARWTIAHAVHLDDEEVNILKNARSGVAHCPTSNLKLGSGICNVPRLRAAGIPVALGSDGAACNNRLDIFREMSLASILQKRNGDTGALPAREILAMATIEGARAIGLERTAGSLTIGKRADITVIDPRFPSTTPHRDPYTTIVHAASPQNVRDVICDGEFLKRNFKLLKYDEREVAARAADGAKQLFSRAKFPR